MRTELGEFEMSPYNQITDDPLVKLQMREIMLRRQLVEKQSALQSRLKDATAEQSVATRA